MIEHGENLLILGPPGVAKTQLAVGLGQKAIEHGYRVLFTTAAAIIGKQTTPDRAHVMQASDKVAAQGECVSQALVIAVAILFGSFTLPITAPQVLWGNMVPSVALGTGISFEPRELDVMHRLPRAVDRPILTGFGIWRVVFVPLALLAYTLWAFFGMKSHGASDALARTVAVNAITIGYVSYLVNSRSLLDSSLLVASRRNRRGGGHAIPPGARQRVTEGQRPADQTVSPGGSAGCGSLSRQRAHSEEDRPAPRAQP